MFVSFRIVVLSGYVPRSGIAGSYVNCLIAFQWSLLCLVKDGLEKVKSGYGESLRKLYSSSGGTSGDGEKGTGYKDVSRVLFSSSDCV